MYYVKTFSKSCFVYKKLSSIFKNQNYEFKRKIISHTVKYHYKSLYSFFKASDCIMQIIIDCLIIKANNKNNTC